MNEDTALFADLRVVEVGSFVAGPAAATLLGDLGAQVVKVEQPGAGDPWRHQFKRPELPESDTNYLWLLTGRNKRSVAIDLKRAEGRSLLHQLLAGADVMVTNLPLRTRAELGIDDATVRALNPRLVYASMTGYGEEGEERDETSFDTTGWWARSGLMDQARPDPDGPPAKAPAASGDQMCAVSLFAAIVSALYRRQRTGEGGYVGTSLLANGAWQNGVYLQAALCGARFKPLKKRADAWNPLNLIYRCSDERWFSITINPGQQARLWDAFAGIMECPQLLSDPRFATYEARLAHGPALIQTLDAAFARRPAPEWKRRFKGSGIVVSVVARCEDAAGDAQMKANGVLVPLHGEPGAPMTVSGPFFIRGVRKREAERAPDVGQHTGEVLAELGLTPQDIERLASARVVQ